MLSTTVMEENLVGEAESVKKKTVYLVSIVIIFLCVANAFLLVWNLRGKELFGETHGKSDDSHCMNVLIVGDSIGAGDCIDNAQAKWDIQLQEWLEREYHVTCRMTNVSMGGNSSYAGYGRVAALQEGVDYDLAILCYGQNDAPDSFLENYESIIVALREKYPGILMWCQTLFEKKLTKRSVVPGLMM